MSNPLLQNIGAADTDLLVVGGIQSSVEPGVIQIESEQIHYTSASDVAYTGCTRGYKGTSAAAHLKGKAVTFLRSDVLPDLADNDMPLSVASFSVTDVHADIPVTEIFTPTVSGMYRLSFYGLATAAPSGSDAAPNLYTSWTDTHGVQTCFDFAGNLDQTYTDGPNSSVRLIYAVAGTPITFRTSAGVYSGTVRWSFYFSVEKV